MKTKPRPDRIFQEKACVDATHAHTVDELGSQPKVRFLGVPLLVGKVVHIVVDAEFRRKVKPYGGARDAAQKRFFEVVTTRTDAGEIINTIVLVCGPLRVPTHCTKLRHTR